MAKNVGILAMDIYFPPTCVQQVILDFIPLSLILILSIINLVSVFFTWNEGFKKIQENDFNFCFQLESGFKSFVVMILKVVF